MTTISVEDVAALLGRDLTSAEDTRAARLIGYAEGAVEDALPGFSIATGTETTEVVATGGIWTPRYPVSTVNEVTVDGTVLPADSYRFTAKGKFQRVSTSAWPVNGPSWSRLCDGVLVVVDYDFGLDPPPYTIVAEVASAVAATLRRQASNPDGVLSRSETVDGYEYQDSYGVAQQEALAAGLVVDVEAIRKRWSRTLQVTVPLVAQ